MSRRVEKEYLTYNGSGWVARSTRRFVYDEWNVVLVMDGDDNNAVTRKYTWGLDLSGLNGVGPASSRSGIHGAGGIGGLLAAVETGGANQGSYWFLYDGNGNVGQVLDATDQQNIAVAARYEYDPYGNQLASTGPYAAANPFRFSTKWFDAEVDYPNTTNDGLYYYGYRYYLPRLGRWGSRDPIQEKAGRLCIRRLCTSCSLPDAAVLGQHPLGGMFGSWQHRILHARKPEKHRGLSMPVHSYRYTLNAPTGLIDPQGLEEETSTNRKCCCEAGGLCCLAVTAVGWSTRRDVDDLPPEIRDPMAHCLASCRTAKIADQACAAKFWDCRESGTHNNNPDLRNNNVGRTCAARTWFDCDDCCTASYNSGGLVCPDGTRSPCNGGQPIGDDEEDD